MEGILILIGVVVGIWLVLSWLFLPFEIRKQTRLLQRIAKALSQGEVEPQEPEKPLSRQVKEFFVGETPED